MSGPGASPKHPEQRCLGSKVPKAKLLRVLACRSYGLAVPVLSELKYYITSATPLSHKPSSTGIEGSCTRGL